MILKANSLHLTAILSPADLTTSKSDKFLYRYFLVFLINRKLKGGEMKKSVIDWIALVLVIIGGLNWGLVGFFNYDLVASLFGVASAVSRVVYSLVGLSALWAIYMASKD